MQRQLEARLPELDAKAAEVKAQHEQARQRSPLWVSGFRLYSGWGCSWDC